MRDVGSRISVGWISGWLTDGSSSVPRCRHSQRGPVECRLLQRSDFDSVLSKCFDYDTGFLVVKYTENEYDKVENELESRLPLQKVIWIAW